MFGVGAPGNNRKMGLHGEGQMFARDGDTRVQHEKKDPTSRALESCQRQLYRYTLDQDHRYRRHFSSVRMGAKTCASRVPGGTSDY